MSEWKHLRRGIRYRVVKPQTTSEFFMQHDLRRRSEEDRPIANGLLNQYLQGHRRRGVGGE